MTRDSLYYILRVILANRGCVINRQRIAFSSSLFTPPLEFLHKKKVSLVWYVACDSSHTRWKVDHCVIRELLDETLIIKLEWGN